MEDDTITVELTTTDITNITMAFISSSALGAMPPEANLLCQDLLERIAVACEAKIAVLGAAEILKGF